MGAMGNPATSALSKQIIEGLASRSQGQAPSPTQGMEPEQAGDMLSQRLSELGGADPGVVMRKLMQMKQEVVSLIPQLALRIPGMSKHLPTLLKSLDGAIEEIGKASQTLGAVKDQQSSPGAFRPLGGSVASAQQPQPNNQPMPMGGAIPGMG